MQLNFLQAVAHTKETTQNEPWLSSCLVSLLVLNGRKNNISIALSSADGRAYNGGQVEDLAVGHPIPAAPNR